MYSLFFRCYCCCPLAPRLTPSSAFRSHWIRKLTREEKTALLHLTADWDRYRFNDFRFITLFDIECTLTLPDNTQVSFTIPAGFLSDGFSSPLHVGERALVATPLEFIAHDYLFATHATSATQVLTMTEANQVFSNPAVVKGLDTLPQAQTAWRQSFRRGAWYLKAQTTSPQDRTVWQLVQEDWSQRPVRSVVVNTYTA